MSSHLQLYCQRWQYITAMINDSSYLSSWYLDSSAGQAGLIWYCIKFWDLYLALKKMKLVPGWKYRCPHPLVSLVTINIIKYISTSEFPRWLAPAGYWNWLHQHTACLPAYVIIAFSCTNQKLFLDIPKSKYHHLWLVRSLGGYTFFCFTKNRPTNYIVLSLQVIAKSVNKHKLTIHCHVLYLQLSRNSKITKDGGIKTKIKKFDIPTSGDPSNLEAWVRRQPRTGGVITAFAQLRDATSFTIKVGEGGCSFETFYSEV